MDFNALFEATTDEEIEEAIEEAIEGFEIVEEPKKKADPTFIGRLFTLIMKKHGEIIEIYEDIPMNVATRWRKEFRNQGFAVDMIETHTVIAETKKEVVFTPKNYVPALEGRIPATVEMSEQRALEKRIQNHSNMIKKMARNNKVKESVDEKIKIYEKITGNVVFIGSEADCVKWIEARPDFKISEHIAYLPAKVFENLRKKGF